MTADRPYLTVPELAESLGCDQMKILRWLHTGQLAGVNIAENSSGRPRWRIPRESWERFQAARSNQQAPAPAPRLQRRRRRMRGEAVIEFYK